MFSLILTSNIAVENLYFPTLYLLKISKEKIYFTIEMTKNLDKIMISRQIWANCLLFHVFSILLRILIHIYGNASKIVLYRRIEF